MLRFHSDILWLSFIPAAAIPTQFVAPNRCFLVFGLPFREYGRFFLNSRRIRAIVGYSAPGDVGRDRGIRTFSRNLF